MHDLNAPVDVQIIGAGIAGLSLALYLAEQSETYRVRIMAKGSLELCNTAMAKGGIAAVQNFKLDSFKQHIADTFAAGHQKGERSVIEEVVKNAPKRLKDLMRWGVDFDRDKKGFDLHREGGHSAHRILHHADYTGKEIHHKLLQAVRQKNNLVLQERCMAIDFLAKEGRVLGMTAINEKDKLVLQQAKIYVLASGGGGQLFSYTTNPIIATGDGVAMALRAGAKIKDIQYFQFHPTAIYKKNAQQLDLLTEALRGFGAQLVDQEGVPFMHNYHPSADLANRAVVSQAIFEELKKNNADHLYLKLSHLNQQELKQKFPSAYSSCINAGYHPAKTPIPIVPAAHYQCGGILVDHFAKTNLANLYALGECACTNLHGSNRLASNSLSEALVYAHNAAKSIRSVLDEVQETYPELPQNVDAIINSSPKYKLDFDMSRQLSFIQAEMSKIHQGIYAIADFDATAKKLLLYKESIKNEDVKLTKRVAEFRNILELAIVYLRENKNILLNEKESAAFDIAQK